MTELIFNFGLCVLLGYSLFAAITGKLNPLVQPDPLEQRPTWMIGLWASIALTTVLCTGVHMTHGQPSGTGKELIIPGALLMLFLVTPGIIICIFYRRNIQQRLTSPAQPGFDWADFPEELTYSRLPDRNAPVDYPAPAAQRQPDAIRSDNTTDIVTPAYLPSAELYSLNTDELPDAVNDAQQPPGKDRADALRKQLLTERSLRKEAEKHLDFAHKALSQFKSQTNNKQTHARIDLETKLCESTSLRKKLEDDVLRERSRSRSTETKLKTIKKDLVLAKREIRKSTAARAKALSTANKAIAFARQAVEIRARLENEMLTTRDALKCEQTTITTLSRELEAEKLRTQQDIKSIAKQIYLKDKRENSNRSAEDIARKLATHVYSGYEQSSHEHPKPILSDANHGKTG